MNYAITLRELGGPEVLQWGEAPEPRVSPGEIRIRQVAVGLNYADIYHRTGVYPLSLPAVPGIDGAGVVEAVGPGVDCLSPGDAVAYTCLIGAYSEHRTIAADRAVKLPPDINPRVAAAWLSKGLTARYLLREVYRVAAGDTILVHAAAGGVGTVMCQWASSLGATVIGTVSSEAKAVIARENGCAHPIVFRPGELAARVSAITGGAQLPVVYDSIGKDTFMESLDCLRPRGLMVYFGESSGSVGAVPLDILGPKGSLVVTRPTLATFIAAREQLVAGADELFDAIRSGWVSSRIAGAYPLREAAQAHRDLEARRTTGSAILDI